MIGGALKPARFFIDVAGRRSLRDSVRHQQQVDAQSAIAPETGSAIVPPAKCRLRLIEQPETVAKPQIEESLQCCTFCIAAKYFPGPLLRVMYITIIGRDVEVAYDYEFVVLFEFVFQPARE
jgi:hypothetical protein